jgi:hypothetical protein
VDVEQLPVLSVWGEECVYTGSGTEVRVPSAGRGTAASKPAPSPAARVRHPEIQRRSFGRCGRVRHPPGGPRVVLPKPIHLNILKEPRINKLSANDLAYPHSCRVRVQPGQDRPVLLGVPCLRFAFA